MVFKRKEDLMLYLNKLTYIGFGSQAVVYLDKKSGNVLKIFHSFLEEDDEYLYRGTSLDLLRFSHIKNNSFIWPNSVIMVDNEVVGYTRKYINSKPLCEINPLNISLDRFSNFITDIQNDIEIISESGIKTYDMMYNVLYGNNGFKVIDHEEYAFSDKSIDKLIRVNNDSLNYEIMYFLVDCYFNDFIDSYKILKDMYNKPGIDILEFIKLFRNYLSEYVGNDIKRLRDAKVCINKNKNRVKKYERNLFSQSKNYY